MIFTPLLHRTYEFATGCTGPADGARALTSWFLGAYGHLGAANLGICNCARLGSGWSVHAECRASDLGSAPYGAPPHRPGFPVWVDWMTELCDAMINYSGHLGIQCVIFNRRIWSSAYPTAGWRPYNGNNPHTGHAHTELSRAAAGTLTVERIDDVLGGAIPVAPPIGVSPPSAPPNTAPQTWLQEVIVSLPTVRRGDRGAAVRRSQALLSANGYPPANSQRQDRTWDGVAGAGWETACRRWQAAARVRNSVTTAGTGDGVFGRHSWTHALTGRS